MCTKTETASWKLKQGITRRWSNGSLLAGKRTVEKVKTVWEKGDCISSGDSKFGLESFEPTGWSKIYRQYYNVENPRQRVACKSVTGKMT